MSTPSQEHDQAPTSGISRRRLLLTAGGAAVAGGAVAAGGTALITGLPAAQSAIPPKPPNPSLPTLAYTEIGLGVPMPSTIPSDASPEFKAVVEAALAALEQNPVPGAALGVWHDGREQCAFFGTESLNTHVTVGPETLFQLGSLSKTYTATAIWRLIDQGKVKLDGFVREYLPAFKLADADAAGQITIANLLEHSAGFYGSDGSYVGENDDALARYVAEVLPNSPQLFPVGAFPSYNNDGFTLLGRVIEVVSGKPYNDAMDELLLGPLQLEDTTLDRPTAMSRRHVDGHYQGPINGQIRYSVQTPLFLPRALDPAGGQWATVSDVLAYGRFHLSLGKEGPGAGHVSVESLHQMQTPVATWPGLDIKIGRNWFAQEAGGITSFNHNGDTAGCHAVFVAFPEQRLVVALLLNVGGSSLEPAVLNAVAKTYPGLAAYEGVLGLTQSFTVPAKAKPVTLSDAEIEAYVGTYGDPIGTLTLTRGGPQGAPLRASKETKEVKNSYVVSIIPEALTPPPEIGVAFLGKDQGVANGVERMSFIRDNQGRVNWLATGLRAISRRP